MLDSLVIGAGPAGLTAAIYLARFRRSALVIDSGCSRARYIPKSHNTPGFCHGVRGETLLDELREQAARFGVVPRAGCIDALQVAGSGSFEVELDGETLTACTVVLATGIEDVLPEMDGIEDAIRRGVVRLCAVCDGYETEGLDVAVYGPPERGTGHARYMRTFSSRVAIVLSEGSLSAHERDQMHALGIEVIDDARGLSWDGGGRVRVERNGSRPAEFDALYPVLGLRSRSGLATSIGARCTEDEALFVDAHQQTSIPGLYAAGDVVTDLNQISVAFGHAAIAATAIHNRLPHRPRD
jgi:thioredoxin reductase (NADPH)